MPGATLASRKMDPAVVDHEVHPGPVLQIPVPDVASYCRPGAVLSRACSACDPGGDEELGLACGVARGIVVDATAGLDLDGGPAAAGRHRDRPPRRPPRYPSHTPPASRSRRRRRPRPSLEAGPRRCMHQGGPQSRPATGGLDHQRQPEACPGSRSSRLPRSESRKIPCGKRVAARQPVPRRSSDDTLGDRLVEGQSDRRAAPTADVGDSQRIEHVGQGAVLSGGAVDQWE
jgi:hypothetical protein